MLNKMVAVPRPCRRVRVQPHADAGVSACGSPNTPGMGGGQGRMASWDATPAPGSAQWRAAQGRVDVMRPKSHVWKAACRGQQRPGGGVRIGSVGDVVGEGRGGVVSGGSGLGARVRMTWRLSSLAWCMWAVPKKRGHSHTACAGGTPAACPQMHPHARRTTCDTRVRRVCACLTHLSNAPHGVLLCL